MRFVVPAGPTTEAAARPSCATNSATIAVAASDGRERLSRARSRRSQASAGATDFGEYFTYFSFFLVVSALLLAVLFFRLGVEQRLRQVGDPARVRVHRSPVIRRLLLAEAVVLAVDRRAARRRRRDRSTRADRARPAHLVGRRCRHDAARRCTSRRCRWSLGAVGGIVAAVVCVFVSLRAVARLSPRALLTAQSLDAASARSMIARSHGATGCSRQPSLCSGCCLTLGFVDAIGAGRRVLRCRRGAADRVARCSCPAGCARATRGSIAGRGTWAVSRLGFRSAAFRPAAACCRPPDCVGGVHHRLGRRVPP